MKKPEITFDTDNTVYVTPKGENSMIGKDVAESYENMIDTLAMIWQELESKEDWGEDLSPSQIEKIYNALNKAGVEL